jgi:hypothetical protein
MRRERARIDECLRKELVLARASQAAGDARQEPSSQSLEAPRERKENVAQR